MGPVYDVPSAAAQRHPAEEQDELYYASIHLFQNQADAVYSNIRRARAHREAEEEDEEDRVDYTTVKTDNASSAPG